MALSKDHPLLQEAQETFQQLRLNEMRFLAEWSENLDHWFCVPTSVLKDTMGNAIRRMVQKLTVIQEKFDRIDEYVDLHYDVEGWKEGDPTPPSKSTSRHKTTQG